MLLLAPKKWADKNKDRRHDSEKQHGLEPKQVDDHLLFELYCLLYSRYKKCVKLFSQRKIFNRFKSI